jgi:succinate dehydrogenase (ubiquinone) cytochrome b560 subunit
MNNFIFLRQIVFYAKTVKEQQTLFWAKNQKLHRPLSPHLTIYRLPLPAILSITHRATGAALSGCELYSSIFFISIFKFL